MALSSPVCSDTDDASGYERAAASTPSCCSAASDAGAPQDGGATAGQKDNGGKGRKAKQGGKGKGGKGKSGKGRGGKGGKGKGGKGGKGKGTKEAAAQWFDSDSDSSSDGGGGAVNEAPPAVGEWSRVAVRSAAPRPKTVSGAEGQAATVGGVSGGIGAWLQGGLEAARVAELERLAQEQPYDAARHVALIRALREADGPDAKQRVGDARQRMAEHVALSEQQWAGFIQELGEPDSLPAKERQLALLRRACDDWPAPELLLALCRTVSDVLDDRLQAAAAGDDAAAAERRFREAESNWDDALAAGGSDAIGGHVLWDGYREWLEEELPEGEELTARQAALWKRQLSIPSKALKAAKADFDAWCGDEQAAGRVSSETAAVIASAGRAYRHAAALYEERAPFEDKIAELQRQRKQQRGSDTGELMAAWNEYISFEKKRGDAGRVWNLYNRAVRCLPSCQRLWTAAIRYGLPEHRALSAARRAVRCLPRSSTAWLDCLRAAEALRLPLPELASIAALASRMPFQCTADARYVQLGLLAACRRMAAADPALLQQGTAAAEAAIAALKERSDTAGVVAAAALWSAAAGPDFYGRCATLCADTARLLHAPWSRSLASAGRVADARAVLRKAVAKASEQQWRQQLLAEWLQFEQLYGGAKDVDALWDAHGAAIVAAGREEQERERAEASDEDSFSDAAKRKQHLRRQRQKEHRQQDKEARKRELGLDGPGDQSLTVFVWNLPFAAHEEAIVQHLAADKPVDVSQVRLVRDKHGRSKGYAYVEMKDTESVRTALSRDKRPMKDSAGHRSRQVRVVPDDPSRHSKAAEPPAKRSRGSSPPAPAVSAAPAAEGAAAPAAAGVAAPAAAAAPKSNADFRALLLRKK
eukprot:TRINITY_DN8584_c0_g3_i2.p1 TRINITY_DN8584_c0_g3~~TRINITY_DN8584_c0_g3_i2.p1  ORF type:complete len:875 (+),score=306.38 TRINITY_DN8584_c0_g3_i2:51-2675(+)